MFLKDGTRNHLPKKEQNFIWMCRPYPERSGGHGWLKKKNRHIDTSSPDLVQNKDGDRRWVVVEHEYMQGRTLPKEFYDEYGCLEHSWMCQ